MVYIWKTININGRYIIINKIKFKVSVTVELIINVGTPEKKKARRTQDILFTHSYTALIKKYKLAWK